MFSVFIEKIALNYIFDKVGFRCKEFILHNAYDREILFKFKDMKHETKGRDDYT